MGNKQFDKQKCTQCLRQAITRMNIHRQKKLNHIAKLKDDICKHLSSQNEMNAKIWCETLINEEGLVPCYDITSTMCDQIRGRIEYIVKFGAPPDMTQTFATVIHVAPKLNVEELMQVRAQLEILLGKEFTMQSDEDMNFINPMVAENIDFKKPLDGHVIYRMRQLAKERNIQYEPTYDMQLALNSYMDMKGLQDPMSNEPQKIQQMPVYNPPQNPPNQGGDIPPSMPPPSGPPGGGFGGQPQQMQPQMPPQMPPAQPQMYPKFDPNAGGNAFQPPAYQPDMNMAPQMPPQQMPQMPPPMAPANNTENLGVGMPVMPSDIDPNNKIKDADEVVGGNDIDDLEARLRALDGK